VFLAVFVVKVRLGRDQERYQDAITTRSGVDQDAIRNSHLRVVYAPAGRGKWRRVEARSISDWRTLSTAFFASHVFVVHFSVGHFSVDMPWLLSRFAERPAVPKLALLARLCHWFCRIWRRLALPRGRLDPAISAAKLCVWHDLARNGTVSRFCSLLTPSGTLISANPPSLALRAGFGSQ
jgi:hypothetical protein